MGVRIKRTPSEGKKRGCWAKFSVLAAALLLGKVLRG